MNTNLTQINIKISNALLDYYETLRPQTEISTYEAFLKVFGVKFLSNRSCVIEGESVSDIDFFEVDRAIRANAKKRNLILDSSKYEGKDIGLPYTIRYVIKKHKGGNNG